MFEVALQESNREPDVVCMLAQVLWAKGGVAEKDAARTQLFDVIENHPKHVQAIALLAVTGCRARTTGTPPGSGAVRAPGSPGRR